MACPPAECACARVGRLWQWGGGSPGAWWRRREVWSVGTVLPRLRMTRMELRPGQEILDTRYALSFSPRQHSATRSPAQHTFSGGGAHSA
uniref:Uncharacterized protein n=1 Tax=Knipowitschia caucasica TaxID=637954 RepID=A0AAV2K2C4_KNICA